ncbi:MAG: RNase P modulator RnpM [Actinomycetota bacterium]
MNRSEPERSCFVCRRHRPKPDLLRIVRSPEGGVSVDPTGKSDGRGAYVCKDDPTCGRAITRRGALSRSLRVALGPDDLARLAAEIEKESIQA